MGALAQCYAMIWIINVHTKCNIVHCRATAVTPLAPSCGCRVLIRGNLFEFRWKIFPTEFNFNFELKRCIQFAALWRCNFELNATSDRCQDIFDRMVVPSNCAAQARIHCTSDSLMYQIRKSAFDSPTAEFSVCRNELDATPLNSKVYFIHDCCTNRCNQWKCSSAERCVETVRERMKRR